MRIKWPNKKASTQGLTSPSYCWWNTCWGGRGRRVQALKAEVQVPPLTLPSWVALSPSRRNSCNNRDSVRRIANSWAVCVWLVRSTDHTHQCSHTWVLWNAGALTPQEEGEPQRGPVTQVQSLPASCWWEPKVKPGCSFQDKLSCGFQWRETLSARTPRKTICRHRNWA